MDTRRIQLQPLSKKILLHLYRVKSSTAAEIADTLFVSTRACDAAVTKSLIRWGFAVRKYKISALMKRESSYIEITPAGELHVEEAYPDELLEAVVPAPRIDILEEDALEMRIWQMLDAGKGAIIARFPQYPINVVTDVLDGKLWGIITQKEVQREIRKRLGI